MPFIYKFLIDNEEVDVEIGFSTSRKWEESLDEASVVVPFSYLNEKPYKMFSLLEIEINEIDNYTDRNVIDTKKRTYLIYSDRVEAVGSYGYFRHNVSAIEYTAKLDYYFINQLAKSRNIIKNTPAPFTSNIYRTEQTVSGGKRYGVNVVLENIKVNENYKTNETIRFEKVNEASVFRYFYPDGIEDDYYVKRQTAIRATNTLLNITTETHILSNNPIEYNLEKGEWKIEYGFIGLAKDVVYGSPYVEGFNVSHTFYIEIVDNTDLSMYDIVNEIRDMISKFGGIEDTIYYDTTRIFNIDTAFEDLLKKTQAPQIYLNGTTARQMLIYALSFINALPRLEYNADDLDLLTLEMYNLSVGDYETEDVVGFGSQQNTNQIGTKNYQVISQALSNNLDDASITTPSNNAFQTVRSKDIQITKDNFVLKLVENAPLYMPIKLEVYVPKIKITGNEPGTQITTLYEKDDFVLDLTSRFINSEEWKLKVTTDNFYNIDMTEPMKQNSGMRLNKVENISWNIGDTEINLSQSFGVVWQDNLIKSVVVSALNEYFTLNLPPVDFVDASNEKRQALFYGLEYTLPNDYKDWKFRVEYITDERLVIKQDKEDISQVSFYSEMRQNQEESLVDLVRQSKKAYGDLQRTGNIAFSFVKKHTKFSEFYEVGEKDKDDYTITQIDTQWFNDYALSTYSVTQYHNRIQQATFVNQKYRPFDNYTKNVLNRHEHYGDYLIAVPPDFIEILEQPTKIYSNDKTVRQISDILLGKTHKLNDNVSVALIRTDGMLEENPDGIYTTNFISTPVTSRGIKGGFAFTFGFSGNMVAGDGLVQKGSNWYNSAVRYTDKKGRFTRFGFMLLNELEIGGDDAYKEYPLLKIPNTEVFDEESDFHKRISFWCRFPYLPDGYVDALVWNKDPLTNASLTYQLNVLSYYMGLYIFGMSFFTENFIVKKYNLENIDNFIGAKLYIYKNNMKYALFEDIYIKGGYYQEIELNASNIEFNPLNNEITFKDINLDGVTSWAIGLPQKDGSTPKLLVACNENLNGIKFVKRHARPNIFEIGNKQIEPIKYTVTFVDYDGTILDTQIVYYGGSAIAPTEPSRVGYIFNGWDIDFTNVTSDLTVTATYFAEPKIYDLLNDVIDTNALNQGDIINCDYSGTSQNITLPAGSYQLEVWGGQGEQLGGLGGYTKGTLNLINTKTLYLFVGGSGSNRWLNGGFITVGNNGADCSYIGTHASSRHSMFIVAGGGGGGTYPSENRKGGYGGGLTGGFGDSGSYSGGGGGSQTTGGYSAETNGSGVWGAAQNLSYGNGGGGGWYGGGAAKVGSPTGGGGGGSGYVFTETSVKSTYYDDYLDSSFYLVDTLMLAGNQEMPSKSGIGTTIGNAYNGYIRITVL